MRAFEKAIVVNQHTPMVKPKLCFVRVTFTPGNRYHVKFDSVVFKSIGVYHRKRIHFPYEAILEFICRPESVFSIIHNGLTVIDDKSPDVPLLKMGWFKLRTTDTVKRKNALIELNVQEATYHNEQYMQRVLGYDDVELQAYLQY